MEGRCVQPIVDKIIKKIAGWRGKATSPPYWGRLILMKTYRPIYLMSFIKFLKWAIQLINSYMAHCLWNDCEGHRVYHMVNWSIVSLRKEYGRLGVPDLRHLNISLLDSWVKRYASEMTSCGNKS